ncbi:polynucleotide kinase-phosphatase [Actinoalloteichus hoggarensis]|uniref:Bis(5'-nucleosyl)-tetraphosphatase PrpE [asymmetrical] n=1 Tax=Actinoalloteichus hoggarensis TaxID=1470176 RepID=A0A221VY35_9PSEU|nr:polynucleotide kinase-phosphatase [Actinoalloteichus hoggarensis]ASO18425.1 Bis(5'-nucleosyl)-tetraphosphatase PrpE [asymmetrical] [Actinoalloteichus hoggarensis]MBB5921791.1 polynucleotide kinase-phosphatase [Actinoalloteichus hoggarensis]
MSTLALPRTALVVLIGATGSGKSTFARTHFRPSQILASDAFRAMVGDDENDQSVTVPAFEALHHVAGVRLALGRLTVIDATNVRRQARASLVRLAREHDVLPVAVVLDLPEGVCVRRNADRADRDFGADVVRRHRAELRRSIKNLAGEGFRRVHVLRSPEEVADAEIVLEPLRNDRRDETGPFDVIGDVHGCRSELTALLGELGYRVRRDSDGRAVGADHPEGRRAVFVGDLVDRGPDTPGVLRLVMGMVSDGTALCVSGNHEAKLLRALQGRRVSTGHGLAESLAQLAEEPPEFGARVRSFCDSLVAHYVLDGGRLVVAHAGLPERYHGRASGRVRSFALFGDTTGETDEFGLPVRYPWADDYRGSATVLYGHTPVSRAEWVNNTLCLDTGCVFGGRLTALRYPERELVSVPAERVWYEPVRPPSSGSAAVEAAAAAVPGRSEPDVLRIEDVAGRRAVQTAHHGRVTVREEQAAAALEVISRFSLDPRWLAYLPPTMAPSPTSARSDLLEHPDEAFAAYRAAGVRRVICEEKHMGSRAVVLVCRDAETARTRFGMSDTEQAEVAGAVYTRTGRSFFDPPDTRRLLDRVRLACDAAGLWAERASDWLLFDAELLPWNAKADQLIRDDFAAVGAAAELALPAAVATLSAAAARGADVTDLLVRTRRRVSDAEAFRAVYRRHTVPMTGLDDVRLAPFQLLAAEGATFEDRPHAWHLAVADRLAAAVPGTFHATGRVEADLEDAASVDAAAAWWTALTAEGGEGMVVKPAANLTRAKDRLVQAGLKVRGREYLRIVYGPDYLQPANLTRLRDRKLDTKRSLALREYALGLEGLSRLVAGEPLWRVHECAFAVLALESDPVDPRL